MMIAFSSVSHFNARLPLGDANSSFLDLTMIIRDTFDCVTELNMTSVVIRSDPSIFAALMNISQNPPTTNPLLQILSSGNQNILAQLLTSISQLLTQLNDDSVTTAILSKYVLITCRLMSISIFRWCTCIKHLYLLTSQSNLADSDYIYVFSSANFATFVGIWTI